MTESNLLHNVARLFNIQINLYDGFGHLMQPPPEAILRVLNILGAPVERMDDLAGALRQRRQFLMQRAIDPVVVAWDGAPLRLKLRLPSPLAAAEPRYRIDLESGEFVEGKCQSDFRIKPVERCIEGVRYVARWIVFPETLPLGYHRLHLQVGALNFRLLCFVIYHCKPTAQQPSTLDSGVFSVPYTPSPPRKTGAPAIFPTWRH